MRTTTGNRARVRCFHCSAKVSAYVRTYAGVCRQCQAFVAYIRMYATAAVFTAYVRTYAPGESGWEGSTSVSIAARESFWCPLKHLVGLSIPVEFISSRAGGFWNLVRFESRLADSNEKTERGEGITCLDLFGFQFSESACGFIGFHGGHLNSFRANRPSSRFSQRFYPVQRNPRSHRNRSRRRNAVFPSRSRFARP